MRPTRPSRLAALRAAPSLLLAAAVVSCAPDAATAPVAPPAAPGTRAALLGIDVPIVGETTSTVTGVVEGVPLVGTVGGVVNYLVTGLLGCAPQQQLRATKLIGPLGGRIAVGDHELVVPQGALSQWVQITATQQSGSLAEVDFQPHGLRFAKPAALRMNYSTCTVPPDGVQSIVYLNDSNQILETPPSVDDAKADAVTALINHFSGYAIATGRGAE
ncbi:MAG: hypothetical protein ACJ79S_17040 [Gemmatimonadaceae bacterium]